MDELENEKVEGDDAGGGGNVVSDDSVSDAGDAELEQSEEGAEAESSEEEKAEQVEAKPARKDPTEGMTPEQAVEYWRKRATHFEGDYKKERTKRQGLQRTGLEGIPIPKDKGSEKPVATKPREEMTPDEFAEDLKKGLLAEVEEKFTAAQISRRVESSETWARQQYDGSDGKPTYDEMFDKYVAPFIMKNPGVYHVLKVMPNPAEATYALGYLLNPELRENGDKQTQASARKDLVKKINDATKKATTISGNGRGMKTSTKKDAKYYNGLSDNDFEREIEEVKNA